MAREFGVFDSRIASVVLIEENTNSYSVLTWIFFLIWRHLATIQGYFIQPGYESSPCQLQLFWLLVLSVCLTVSSVVGVK
jgi:hypothetical protein